MVMSRQRKKNGKTTSTQVSMDICRIAKKTARNQSRGRTAIQDTKSHFLQFMCSFVQLAGDMAHTREQASTPTKQPGI
jgi:hypothetical protein